MTSNSTPPRSQNPSPLPSVPDAASQTFTILPGTSGYMRHQDQYSLLQNTSLVDDQYTATLELPTPIDTPNKSFEFGSEYDEENGSNMLLASLMEDISSLSTAVAEGKPRQSTPTYSLSGAIGVAYHRRHSLPISLAGLEASNRTRTSNNLNGNSRLSKIPEFGGSGNDSFHLGSLGPEGANNTGGLTGGIAGRNFYHNSSLPIPSMKGQSPWAAGSFPSSANFHDISPGNKFPAFPMVASTGNQGNATYQKLDHFQPKRPQPLQRHSAAAENGKGAPFGSSVTGNLTCYLVQFTCGRTDTFYVPPGITLTISIGDYVIVEADRGEDLGRVIMNNINVPLPRRNSSSAALPPYVSGNGLDETNGEYLPDTFSSNVPFPDELLPQMAMPTSNLPKKIYRIATAIEIESLLGKVRDEINAISVGQFKVQEWKLPMAIIDAEYQWDRRKLTFFFSVTLPQFYPNQPAPRIDFRTLVRDLYQIYRTRIWMFCVDKDKNRSCRSNNREKFLKQLYEDVKVSPGTPFDFCGGFSACDDAENGQQQEKNDRNYIANSSLSFEGLPTWSQQIESGPNYTEFGVTQI